jgi:hypothetical protein
MYLWGTLLKFVHMAWYHTKFHDDRFRRLSNVNAIAATIWKAVVFVLLMGMIYEVHSWMNSGGMLYQDSWRQVQAFRSYLEHIDTQTHIYMEQYIIITVLLLFLNKQNRLSAYSRGSTQRITNFWENIFIVDYDNFNKQANGLITTISLCEIIAVSKVERMLHSEMWRCTIR